MDVKPNICWIVGRKATIASNGHEYITGPFLVFDLEDEADACCAMVARVSGEKPMKVEASKWRCFEGAR